MPSESTSSQRGVEKPPTKEEQLSVRRRKRHEQLMRKNLSQTGNEQQVFKQDTLWGAEQAAELASLETKAALATLF